jgi:hypothetical protein
MGIYYTARTIIGYRLAPNRFDSTVVPNCPHGIADDAKFCPVCGKAKGTRVKETMRPAWEAFRYQFLEMQLPDHIVFEDDFENENHFWIGYHAGSCDEGETDYRPLDLPYLANLKQELDDLLNPFVTVGLFELFDDNFGIWTTNTGH